MEAKTEDLRYHHFSHDHLLDYTKLQPHVHATCSGCRRTISPGKFYYKCKLCGFYLHQVCFNMPENVTHPSDPNHNLTLETFPTPSKLPIQCKACQNSIKGFYYRCSKCTHYYHTLCLASPLSMKTPLHRHSLNIEFVPVYDFQCDLCDKPSYSGWVYHCNLCEFDSHLSCVLTNNGSTMPSAVESHPIVAADNQRRDELIDLLTRGSDDILPQDDHQPMMLSNDQDHGIQSFQLSETCFSIDFQNSLLGNDDDDDKTQSGVRREVAIPEEMRMYDHDGDSNQQQGFEESYKRSEKSRSSNYSQKSASGGIGAHIWTELEQATEKRNSKGGGDTRVESDSGRWSSMGLPSFMCCFINGESKGIRGKISS
ncbi:uncharacterized protein LOC112505492 [Cynara cardunculus var. scolymus]|uniref:uncharacterized protein LOC112505492 n=1 Tax=Cynara cardunculus var. scolymus TaxID=59895 RepID=UPI000D6246A1|nr:uncharacterized protein LOC112505492 [Cynara cardunculus var. scolymus]